MNVGFGGAHRLTEDVGRLGIGQSLHVAEDDRRAVPLWELRDQPRQAPLALGAECHGLRLFGLVGRQHRTDRSIDRHRIERGAPKPIAHHVEHDLVQPRPHLELAPPFGRIVLHSAIRAYKCVLRRFLGIA